jgi:endonuclease YncB( thermonuclease family)
MNWFKENILGLKEDEPEPLITPEEKTRLQNDYLMKCDYKSIDFYHLRGYECWAKVLRVVDGDTCYCCFFIHGKPFKYRIRLAGMDTAEKRSTDEKEREWALKAEEKFKELVADDLVWLKCQKFDKYGRLLVDMFHEEGGGGFSYNETLKELGLAYAYYGRKRTPFREWAPAEALGDTDIGNQNPVDNIGDPRMKEVGSIEKEDYKKENNVDEMLNKVDVIKQ